MNKIKYISKETQKTFNDNKILTTKDIMELLSLGRVTVYKLITDGKLKAAKISGKYRTTTAAVFEFMENEMGSCDSENGSTLWYNQNDCYKGTR